MMAPWLARLLAALDLFIVGFLLIRFEVRADVVTAVALKIAFVMQALPWRRAGSDASV